MTRALQLLVLLMAVLALTLHGVADAHCRVKADAKTMDDTTAVRASDDKKNARGRNKMAFDVPKSASNTTDYDDNDDEY
jgi:hypothetical protein